MKSEVEDLPGSQRAIPVVEEQLEIHKRQRVTGIVRLEKTVRTSNALVDQELISESVSITRVPINRILAEPAVTRQEGDTTVIPVMEETVVVTRQLVLKEEIRITRQQQSSRYQESVPVRAEEIHIERLTVAPDMDSELS